MEKEDNTVDKKLPEELWWKIVSYIPKKNRIEIQLVNSYFYGISCDMHKFDRKLVVTEDNVSQNINL